MTGERPYYVDDIIAAVREGRIGAETAVEWLLLRASERARISAGQQAQDQEEDVLFDALFPEAYRKITLKPGGQLPEEYPPPRAHEGGRQGKRIQRVTSWDGYVLGSDGDLGDYYELFSEAYKRRQPGWGGAE
jgi:hypothetical protein